MALYYCIVIETKVYVLVGKWVTAYMKYYEKNIIVTEQLGYLATKKITEELIYSINKQ